MPFSTSLEVITEESQNHPQQIENKADATTNENEAMSKRSLVLLQKRDEELKMLQMRIRSLEQMSTILENRKMQSGFKLMQEDGFDEKDLTTQDEEYYERSGKGIPVQPKRSWQLLENEFIEESSYEDDPAMSKIIQNNNLQLKKELLSESRMRLQDRQHFIEVLDKVHEALKKFRTNPDITPCQEFLELAAEWFRRECNPDNGNDVDHFGTLKMERSLNSLESFDEYVGNKMKTILKSSSSTSKELFSKNEEKVTTLQELATRVDSMIDGNLVKKLDQIKNDLNGLQLVLQNGRDRVAQERRIQQVAQSAWRARFEIQLKTIKRLESRYQKMCRCLMKFRRRVKKEQKAEKKSKKNKRANSVTFKDGLGIRSDKICTESKIEKEKEQVLKRNELTAFLQGRLKSLGLILAQNRTKIQELTNDKKALEKEVSELKQESLRVNSNTTAMNLLADNFEKDRLTTCNKNSPKHVEEYELLSSQIISLKDKLELAEVQVNVLKDEKNSLIEEKKAIEVELKKIKDYSVEMEENFNQKLTIEKSKVHAFEQKFSEFYKQSGLHVQEARERITTANKKLREFFKTIQIFIEKVDAYHYSKSTPLTEAYEGTSAIPRSHFELLKRSNQDNFNKWTSYCRALAKNENFAEEMAEFLFGLVGGNKQHSLKSDILSEAVEVGSI